MRTAGAARRLRWALQRVGGYAGACVGVLPCRMPRPPAFFGEPRPGSRGPRSEPMNTQGPLIASLLVAFATLLSGEAPAATFCVDSSDALTAALATAEANGEDNDIRLHTGVYDVPDAGFRI